MIQARRYTKTQSPLRLALVLLLLVSFVEFGVMELVVPQFDAAWNGWVPAIVDTSILLAVLIPCVFLLLFRPMSKKILELEQAEKEMDRVQARLQLAMEGGHLALWDMDFVNGKVWLSEEWAGFIGDAKRETWTTIDALNALVHPEDRQGLLSFVAAVLKGEQPGFAEEYRVRAATGAWRWVLSRGQIIERAADGRATHASGIVLDITERVQTEEALKASEERSRTLIESAPQSIILTGPDGCIALVNAQTETTFGYRREELAGRNIEALVPERYRRQHAGLLSNYLAAPTARSMGAGRELFGLRKDGTEVPVEIGLRPVRIAGCGYVLASVVDISERKQVEAKMRADERRYQDIIDTSIDGFWIVDTDGRIVEANDAYCRLIGYARADVLKMRVQDVEAMESAEDVTRHVQKIMATGHDRFETRHRRRDGQILDIEVSAKFQSGQDGERFICFVRDITERKHAAAAVAEALRAKSEFMANVTHELRTPLNSVIGFAELLKDEVPGPLNAKQASFAADILAGGQRLLALVEGILEMSRLDADGALLKREPVDIGAVLEQRVAARREAGAARRVSINLEVAADAGSAKLDPGALNRMLDALIDNAIKFNREGSTVAVSARRAGGALEIAVADTGIGIARADLARIFEPLTQLDAGLARRQGGVGLGLALVRRLAELHGGSIEVESEPDKGSTFTLSFPIKDLS